jgi:hypothetical protein
MANASKVRALEHARSPVMIASTVTAFVRQQESSAMAPQASYVSLTQHLQRTTRAQLAPTKWTKEMAIISAWLQVESHALASQTLIPVATAGALTPSTALVTRVLALKTVRSQAMTAQTATAFVRQPGWSAQVEQTTSVSQATRSLQTVDAQQEHMSYFRQMEPISAQHQAGLHVQAQQTWMTAVMSGAATA